MVSSREHQPREREASRRDPDPSGSAVEPGVLDGHGNDPERESQEAPGASYGSSWRDSSVLLETLTWCVVRGPGLGQNVGISEKACVI